MGTVLFNAERCYWDIICRYRDHDQLIYGSYFRKADAWDEVARLRQEYPKATICVRAGDAWS